MVNFHQESINRCIRMKSSSVLEIEITSSFSVSHETMLIILVLLGQVLPHLEGFYQGRWRYLAHCKV